MTLSISMPILVLFVKILFASKEPQITMQSMEDLENFNAEPFSAPNRIILLLGNWFDGTEKPALARLASKTLSAIVSIYPFVKLKKTINK